MDAQNQSPEQYLEHRCGNSFFRIIAIEDERYGLICSRCGQSLGTFGFHPQLKEGTLKAHLTPIQEAITDIPTFHVRPSWRRWQQKRNP